MSKNEHIDTLQNHLRSAMDATARLNGVLIARDARIRAYELLIDKLRKDIDDLKTKLNDREQKLAEYMEQSKPEAAGFACSIQGKIVSINLDRPMVRLTIHLADPHDHTVQISDVVTFDLEAGDGFSFNNLRAQYNLDWS